MYEDPSGFEKSKCGTGGVETQEDTHGSNSEGRNSSKRVTQAEIDEGKKVVNKRVDNNKYVPEIHVLNKGITINQIEEFENTYMISLPLYYKTWLSLNNGGELFAIPVGTNIAGILGDTKRKTGIFYLEDNFDKRKRVGIPNNIFVFADTCGGNIIGFDLNRTNQYDGVVVYWNHEIDGCEEEWNSFGEWLQDEMNTGKIYLNYDGSDKD